MALDEIAERYAGCLVRTPMKSRERRLNRFVYGMRRVFKEAQALRPEEDDDGADDVEQEILAGAYDDEDGEPDYDKLAELEAKLEAEGLDALDEGKAPRGQAAERRAYCSAFETAEAAFESGDYSDETCNAVAAALSALRSLLVVWESPMDGFEQLVQKLEV